jgi:hypothetical protein
MRKLFNALAIVILLSQFNLIANAQEVEPTATPAPEEIVNKEVLSTPADILVSGANKSNQLSGEIIADLTEIPQSAEILDVELTFDQTGTSEGILKLLNKRSFSIIDSISLGREGAKATTRIDTTVKEWITSPEKNFGLVFQTSELGEDNEVNFSNITFKFEYYLPDRTNPEITKLEIKTIDAFTVKVTWETNEPVLVTAKFGKTSNYDKEVTGEVEYKDAGVVLLTGLSENITYHMKFFAKDSSGNTTETGNTVFTTNSGTTSGIAENESVLAPRLLNYELIPDRNHYNVELAWSKSESSNITGYVLFRNTGDGEYSEYSRFDSVVTRYTDMKLESDTTYSYYVIAYSGTVQSGRSPVVQVKVPVSANILGIDSMFERGNSNLAVFFILSGFAILLGASYFMWKKVKLNMAYNEKINRHSRLHNVLHDPDYFINGYEDSVIEKVND